MRYVIVLVVFAVLAVAFVGGHALDGLFGSAGAATATRMREDQITMFSQADFFQRGPNVGSDVFASLSESGPILVALDPADYPSTSTFRLEGVWIGEGAGTTCLRLFDRTTNLPIVGSEACHATSAGAAPESVRARSATFALPTGPHEYTLEGKCNPCVLSSTVFAARVIAEWTERTH